MIRLRCKTSSRQGHAGTIRAQHRRQKIVRDAQQTRSDTILREQQPPAQALLQIVQAIAARGLRDLQSVNRRVPVQQNLQARTRWQYLFQRIHGDSEAVSANLHYRAVRAPAKSRRHGDRRKALVAHHSDFDALSTSGCEHERDHARVQEVGILEFLIRLMKAAALREAYELQVRPDQTEFVVGNREQYPIRHRFSFRTRPLSGLHRWNAPVCRHISVRLAHDCLRLFRLWLTRGG